jgi:hypothetical protein
MATKSNSHLDVCNGVLYMNKRMFRNKPVNLSERFGHKATSGDLRELIKTFVAATTRFKFQESGKKKKLPNDRLIHFY